MTTLTPAPNATASRPAGPPTSAGVPRRRRVAALDGLRAVAVIAVIVFHVFPGTLRGGFAGVDVFFVLSGYLITGGLVAGELGPRQFWLRRVRRILPGLIVLVLGCGVLVRLAGGDAGVNFGRQVIAAAGFGTNWVLIGQGNSYFTEGAPPLFQNLWSLAVEEQFYLLWPMVLLTVLRFVRTRGQALSVVLVLAAASVLLMAGFGLSGHIGRAYYGSDTHAFGLLAGAALAIALYGRGPMALSRARIASAGVAALSALVLMFFVLDGTDPMTYVVGLPAVVGATLLFILVVSHDDGLLARTLGAEPVAALGRLSYGLYLWHWPLLILLRNAFPTFAAEHAVATGWATIGLTLLASALSYRLVESPIRRHGFGGYLAAVRVRVAASGGSGLWRLGLGSLAGLVAVAMTVAAVVQAPRSSLEERQIEDGARAIAQAAATTPTYEVVPGFRLAPSHSGKQTRPGTITVAPTGAHISAIGDSVMLAAAPALLDRFPGIAINAVVSRQPTTAPDLLRTMARHHHLRPIVLIGLGTNGYLGSGTLAAIREVAGPHRELVFVNSFAKRTWEGEVNHDLAAFVAHDKRSVLVDWHSAIGAHTDLLGPDRIHPGPAGGRLYAATVAAALKPLTR